MTRSFKRTYSERQNYNYMYYDFLLLSSGSGPLGLQEYPEFNRNLTFSYSYILIFSCGSAAKDRQWPSCSCVL